MSAGKSYDEVPYPGQAHRWSNPNHVAAMAALVGLEAPAPESASVLELGCGNGFNLMAMAQLYPQARLLGIDASAVQIEDGRRVAAQLGLDTHLELRAADLMAPELLAPERRFDYIVAHGLYSWVPQAVRARILELIYAHLQPRGVAYVSFNAKPGWFFRQIVREMMQWHTRHIPHALGRVAEGRQLLDAVVDAVPESETAYKAVLDAEKLLIDRVPDPYLRHDHLSDHHQAFWLHEFVSQLEHAGLQYLTDSDFRSVLPEGLPKAAFVDNWSASDAEREQYRDFAANRYFRRSLIIHYSAHPARRITADRIATLYLASPATLDDPSDPDSAFVHAGTRVKFGSALARAGLLELTEAWPVSLRFDALLERAKARLAPDESLPEHPHLSLAGDLLRCFAGGLVQLSHGPWLAGRPGPRPRSNPLARVQVERGAEILTSLRQDNVRLGRGPRTLLRLCDGTRDRAALLEDGLAAMARGEFQLREGEVPITEPQRLRQVFDGVLDQVLDELARGSFFLAEADA